MKRKYEENKDDVSYDINSVMAFLNPCLIRNIKACNCSKHTFDFEETDLDDFKKDCSQTVISTASIFSNARMNCDRLSPFSKTPATYVWSPSLFDYDKNDYEGTEDPTRDLVSPRRNVVTWPRKTDICCWWDCHQFTTPPFPLPIKLHYTCKAFPGGTWPKEKWNSRPELKELTEREYRNAQWKDIVTGPIAVDITEEQWNEKTLSQKVEYLKSIKYVSAKMDKINRDFGSRNQFIYECIGCFCGPSCALAYAQEKGFLIQAKSHITSVARMFGYFGYHDTMEDTIRQQTTEKIDFQEKIEKGSIVPAPPRELLKMFSGEKNGLSIEEFRKLCLHGIHVSIRDKVFITNTQLIEAYNRRQDNMINLCKAVEKKKEEVKSGIAQRHSSLRSTVTGVKKLEVKMIPTTDSTTGSSLSKFSSNMAPTKVSRHHQSDKKDFTSQRLLENLSRPKAAPVLPGYIPLSRFVSL